MKLFTPGLRVFLFLLLLAPGVVQAQAAWQWVTTGTVGSQGFTPFIRSAVDAAGNTVVAGTFKTPLTLGTITLNGAGPSNLFVARLNAAGQWTQAVEVAGTDFLDFYGTALALDGNGEVVLAGRFSSASVAFGNFTLTNVNPVGGRADVFVARLNSAGQWTQALRAGGMGDDAAVALAVEPDGTCIIAGEYGGAGIQLGTTTLANQSPGGNVSDVFVARLDRSGQWSQAAGAGGRDYDSVMGLVSDGIGGAVIAGNFSGSAIRFGTLSASNVSGGHSDIYVARVDRTGQWTQVRSAGGFHPDHLSALTLDNSGNVIVAGFFTSSTCAFGSLTLTKSTSALNTQNLFVARLSSAGVWTQAVQSSSTDSDIIAGLVTDGSGNVTVAGSFVSPVLTLGSLTLPNASPGTNTRDLFVAQLSATGQWTQGIRAGGSENDDATGLVAGPSGTLIIPSTSNSPVVQFGPFTFNQNNSYAPFVGRLNGLITATTAPSPTERFTLAPNPATTSVRLSWPEATSTPRPVLLLDPLGREVRRQVLPAHATAATLDVAGLAPGLYQLRCGVAVGKVAVE